MLESSLSRGLERNIDLATAATYERVVMSGIDSVWENVFDWEHLPWLHSQAFTSIEHRDSGEWGWRADIGFPGGAVADIELVVDREAQCYVSRTLSGAGAPSEIWTTLNSLDKERTAIQVEFFLEDRALDVLEQTGAAYRALYTVLWDQDEEMMQVRDRSVPKKSATAVEKKEQEELDLGPSEALLKRLPLRVEFGGHSLRLVESEGQIFAHATECPHWRGPLTECAVDDGIVTCPWHGYRFEVASGRSADGRGLKLRTAPTKIRWKHANWPSCKAILTCGISFPVKKGLKKGVRHQ